MNIGIDIHGVLDKYPEKFIKEAKEVMKKGGKAFIITGPSVSYAEKELKNIANKYNNGEIFYSNIYSIVDWVIENNLPWYKDENGFVWTEKLEDWNRAKGEIAKVIKLNVHYDNTKAYQEYFPPETNFILID